MQFNAFIFFSLLTLNASADEFKDAKVDFYKGAREFVGEVDSIITNKQYMNKINLDELFEGKVENIETLEAANRKVSIDSFDKYIKQYPNSDFIPDALYRLGKLYFEESSQKLVNETETYEREFRRFLRGEIQVLPPEPNVDYLQATRVLNRLVEGYKDYRFRDDALYLLGYCYFEEGKVEKAMAVFNRLIKEFPKSDKIPEVYTRLGEHYFDVDDFSRAIYYYSHVMEYPDTVYYENVLYKLAWIYYHKKKVVEASEYFSILIDHNEKKFGRGTVSSIRNEAKNYIAIGFAEHASGISGAYSFFRKIGGRSYEYEVLRKICELYLLSDRIPEAVKAVDFLMSKYPYEQDNPILQDKLVSSFRRDENINIVNKEKGRMVSLFGERSAWREKNKDNPLVLLMADQLIEKQILSIALYHQEKGDRDKDKREYIKAGQLYYDYLKKHPSDQFLTGTRYNYAQVLFNLGNYDGAIKEYTAVREYSDDLQFKEKSSYGVISSWQNKLKADDPKYLMKEMKPAFDPKGVLLKPQDLSDKEKLLVDACEKYRGLKLKNRRTPYVMYVEAEVYFRNNKLEDARRVYKDIVDQFPDDKVALDAMRNTIASYNYEKDYPKVEEWSNKLLASRKLSDIGDVKDIKGLLTGAVFRRARQMEDNGELKGAAAEYIRLAKQYPKSEYSDAALYNSGLIYEKIGTPVPAVKAYRTMLSKYPKSRYTLNAMFRVAVNYEQRLEFGNAIYFYDDIIKNYPKTGAALDSNYNVARLKRGSGDLSGAANNLMTYQNGVKDQKEKAASVMQAARLYNKAGLRQKAIDTYGLYISKNPKDLDGVMQSYIARSEIYESAGKSELAYPEYKKAMDTFRSSGRSSGTTANNYYANASFKVVQEQVAKYNSIKIHEGDTSKIMKSRYDDKEKLLKQITDQYLKVVELGSAEWTIASLYMIGAVFQRFADFLYDAPVPKELNTEELKNEYRGQVQTQAMPYEDKAIEYYEKCMSESSRLKVSNNWTKEARKKMTVLRPDQYYEYKEEMTPSSPSVDIKDSGFIGQ